MTKMNKFAKYLSENKMAEALVDASVALLGLI